MWASEAAPIAQHGISLYGLKTDSFYPCVTQLKPYSNGSDSAPAGVCGIGHESKPDFLDVMVMIELLLIPHTHTQSSSLTQFSNEHHKPASHVSVGIW